VRESFRAIDRENNLRSHVGNSSDGPGPNRKIAGVRLRACLNTNAEAASGRGIPQRSLSFRKIFDEATECPYSGIRSFGVLGNFKVGRIFSAVPSYVERYHLPAKALYKRLKIVLRVDVQINVQKVCGWQMTSL